ncbi:MAG: triose-phosphate isomerase [Pseudomonadota bacterium]|nr:triose-phosphate isomerase [Pseudomonadota bacterium]
MAMTVTPLIAGNWKMNTDLASATALAAAVAKGAVGGADLLVCPPFPWLSAVRAALGTGAVALGAQDCHPTAAGAHTGDVSAAMLAELGCQAVIVGHSERRAEVKRGGHGETSKLVRDKVLAAQMADLRSIVCVGETLAERKSGDTLKVVGAQLRKSLPDTCISGDTVIAYEPVWAIGSGLTPSVEQIGAVHAHIRKALTRRFGDAGAAMRILYGGSVKPSNAAELMAIANVNGALVGGASLKAADFLGIIGAYRC